EASRRSIARQGRTPVGNGVRRHCGRHVSFFRRHAAMLTARKSQEVVVDPAGTATRLIAPPELRVRWRLAVPQHIVVRSRKEISGLYSRSSKRDLTEKRLPAEDLVQEGADEMYVLVADLDEDASALGEQVSGD